MTDQADMVTRARAMLGVRFRLHGHEPASGLDCVGLIAHAAAKVAPRGYRARAGTIADHATMLITHGFDPAEDARVGDVLLCRSAPGTFHLAIDAGTTTIHADAIAGHVVERPGPAPWPIASRWRLGGKR